MADNPDYTEMVAQAEKAVASVKDPELKRVAFQKVLEVLLSSHTGDAGKSSKKLPRRAKTRPRANTGRSGPRSYLQEMIEEGFFKKPKTITQVKAELENRGHHIPLTSLSGPLQGMCQRRHLRRQRVTTGNKQTFAYSDW